MHQKTNTEFSVRGSRPEELEEAIAATAAAFKVPLPANSYRHFLAIKVPDPENIRILLHTQGKATRVIGSNTIFRFQAHFGPQILDAGGLAWVGVHPDYQRKGLGLLLLDDCISYLEKAHCDLCFLYTSTMMFYHQRGWEVGFGVYKWVIPVTKLTGGAGSKSPNIGTLRRFTPEDLPAIERIYAESNTAHPGTCIRDHGYWSRMFKVHPAIFERLYCFQDGTKLLGYILLEEAGKSPANQLVIEEYGIQPCQLSKNITDLENSFLKVLKILATEKSCTEVGFALPLSYSLVERIKNLGARDLSSLFTGLMVRIIDLKAFLTKWVIFYNEAVVPLVSETSLKQIKDTTVILTVEGYGILLHKEGITLRMEILREFPRDVCQISIDRSVLAILALGNASPADLIDSEMWKCPQEYLPLLECALPNIHLMIYPLDKF